MRKTPLARKSKKKRVVDKTRTATKGYKPPAWFQAIPLGSHGNTPAQKKYWKATSDAYRKADFEQYGGRCVSCSKILDRWQDGHLAHFKAWSVCNSWFKYCRENLALSCPGCNRLDDGMVSYNFAKELQRRHGKGIIEWIEAENGAYRGMKMEVWEIVERTEKLL
jgi:hypothetical protein